MLNKTVYPGEHVICHSGPFTQRWLCTKLAQVVALTGRGKPILSDKSPYRLSFIHLWGTKNDT